MLLNPYAFPGIERHLTNILMSKSSYTGLGVSPSYLSFVPSFFSLFLLPITHLSCIDNRILSYSLLPILLAFFQFHDQPTLHDQPIWEPAHAFYFDCLEVALWYHSDLSSDITLLEKSTPRTLPKSSLVLHPRLSVLQWPCFWFFIKEYHSQFSGHVFACLITSVPPSVTPGRE